MICSHQYCDVLVFAFSISDEPCTNSLPTARNDKIHSNMYIDSYGAWIRQTALLTSVNTASKTVPLPQSIVSDACGTITGSVT